MKAVLLMVAMSFAAAASAGETRPVVVELFTSQSCSSCPPADALLGELAQRPEILALGFHVTYWDGAGWRDPLARQESTERQMVYSRRLAGGQVYTPQMVIDGTVDAVGSDRARVLAAIANARPVAEAAVSFAPDRRSVTVGAGAVAASPERPMVLLARYALSRTTRVAGGENASRTLIDRNGVETLTTLGTWDGVPASFPIESPASGDGMAVLIQAADGHILGAAQLEAR
jgi:hypothetical protein